MRELVPSQGGFGGDTWRWGVMGGGRVLRGDITEVRCDDGKDWLTGDESDDWWKWWL